ncbi:unnamed protein product [Rotaria sordida]|uniref:Uncharacterized protein n=1 Tax=Rotaria sordida TaxID=392033 RepID=A0A815HGA0_9BILA|nr:unnamed protein product [Rotaria sordida]
MMFLSIIDNLCSYVNQLFDQYCTIILVLTFLIIVTRLFNKFWINRLLYSSTQSMEGKTVVITGGNAGIGYETAKDLLLRGARVIIACRNIDKGHQALRTLHFETKCNEQNIRLMECDLASFDSIHKFVKLYNTKEDRLDILICNAGLIYTPNIYSKDGLNYVMQANYLGHFLLTNLLLDKLKKCQPSRIINVSSIAHKYPPTTEGLTALINFKADTMWGSYCPSKACQILSSYKLKHDLRDQGVHVFAVNPGWVWTSFQGPLRPAVGIWFCFIIYPLLRILKFIFAKTPYIGARTTVYCAVEPSLEKSSDLYYENCAPAKPIPLCTDKKSAEYLWNISCETIGL